MLALTSKRQGERRWKVEGANIPMSSGPGKTGTLVAHAYCQNASFELVTESREVAPPVNSTRTFDVSCRNGTRALSGGFDGNVDLTGPQPSATAAITSRRISGGRAWRTSSLSAVRPRRDLDRLRLLPLALAAPA